MKFHGVGWLRKRQWHPTPVLLPGKSHGWRSLVGCSPWGRYESGTTERLHFHFSLSCIGEGNGNPLQCSCLENPRDGGAWWAAVYRVAQSRTQLKRLSSSSSSSLRIQRLLVWFMTTNIPPWSLLGVLWFQVLNLGLSSILSLFLKNMVPGSSDLIVSQLFLQFSQQHLWKRLSSPCILACFVTDWPSGVGLFLGALYCCSDLCVCAYTSMLLWLL